MFSLKDEIDVFGIFHSRQPELLRWASKNVILSLMWCTKKENCFLNDHNPFSLILFLHVYMFSILHNIRKNRTIVTCTCTLRKTQYLHIDNFLHYFSLLEMHWNYTVVDPAGESERVSLLPVFDRLDLICLQFPPGISGIRPCNCLLKM